MHIIPYVEQRLQVVLRHKYPDLSEADIEGCLWRNRARPVGTQSPASVPVHTPAQIATQPAVIPADPPAELLLVPAALDVPLWDTMVAVFSR